MHPQFHILIKSEYEFSIDITIDEKCFFKNSVFEFPYFKHLKIVFSIIIFTVRKFETSILRICRRWPFIIENCTIIIFRSVYLHVTIIVINSRILSTDTCCQNFLNPSVIYSNFKIIIQPLFPYCEQRRFLVKSFLDLSFVVIFPFFKERGLTVMVCLGVQYVTCILFLLFFSFHYFT